jgi:group II intron reverse transcriptase/maturase
MSDDKVRKLQDRLTDAAKSDPKRKFYSLKDKIYRMDVLERAWQDVRQNKGAPGPDGTTVQELEEAGIEFLLSELHEELRTDTYHPGPIRRVYIPKPNGGERPLGIPNVRDRIVQASLKLVIEPIFEADFRPFSYGFRPGRSAEDATREVYKWLNFGLVNVLDADIERCFDEIPHDKLLAAIRRRISDRYVFRLISMWLKSPILDKGELHKSKKGTPQGGVISPLLANIYLHQVDEEWIRSGMCRKSGYNAQMVRYADDIVILSDKPLDEPRKTLQDILARLGLRLSDTKTRVTKAEKGFEFLGFRFTRQYSRKHRKVQTTYFPSPESVKRMKGRIREIAGNNRLHILPKEVVEELNMAVTGWCNYFQWSWHDAAFTKVFSYLRARFMRFLRRRRNKSGFGRARDLPISKLHEEYGLMTRMRSTVFMDRLRRDCSGRAV